MFRKLFVVTMFISLIVAPVPPFMQNATAQTAAPKTTVMTKAKKPPSPAQIALRKRQKKCGAEWKTSKAAGKIEKGMKWPQYWSACNRRLKGGG